MEQRIITMRAIKVGDEILLELRDNEGHRGIQNITTNAHPGDEVIWRLDSNSHIKEIVSIAAKRGSQNVFSTLPHKVSDEEFKGTVADDAEGKEAYNIVYQYEDGTPVADDPFIDVNPPS